MIPSLAGLNDGTLIKLAVEGQADCFTVLMDRHSGAVRRCIGAMSRNTTDAEDLLQEVFLKAWRHLSTFRAESSFRTWLTRVAVNEALQSYRREERRPAFQPLYSIERLASSAESPHRYLDRVEATKAVRRAVAALPKKYRQVLVLRDLEELSVRETAQCLHTSIPLVKTRLFRARLMLLMALQRSTRMRRCPLKC